LADEITPSNSASLDLDIIPSDSASPDLEIERLDLKSPIGVHDFTISNDTSLQPKSKKPSAWTFEEVEQFVIGLGFKAEAAYFRKQEIDGRSLLLLTRKDVLNCFKLGPAIKLYHLISHLNASTSGGQCLN